MKQVHRSNVARVGAWAVIVFVVANLVDIAVQGGGMSSVVATAALLLAAGLAYVVGLRPSIVADETGIVVHNPLRDVIVPWGAVDSITSGDAIRIHCAGEEDRAYRSFILQSSPRSRAKADGRASKDARRRVGDRGRLPDDIAKAVAGRTPADYVVEQLSERHTTYELDRATAERKAAARATAALADGTSGGASPEPESDEPVPTASITWSLPALLALGVPALAVVVTVLIASV
jgi:hypothetical protein